MKSVSIVFFLALTASACSVQSNKEGDIDNDFTDEEILDNNDFNSSFTTSPYYKRWNANGDQVVDRTEFAQGFFATIDKDDDDILNNQEWQNAQEAYFGSDDMADYQTLDVWDQDGDELVQPEEFAQVLEQTDYFAEWDEDGSDQLEEGEVAEGVFAMWDTDGNGVIEAEEYTDWFEKRQSD